MKKIVFLTPHGVEHGFNLTGAIHYTIKEENLKDTLKNLMADSETGLVVIDERLIKGISAERLREMEDRWYGILLILPVPERLGVEVEDYATRLIKRAIGYHVRLKL